MLPKEEKAPSVNDDQKKLKEFVDSEIHLKIKSVLKEQVVKIFSDYA